MRHSFPAASPFTATSPEREAKLEGDETARLSLQTSTSYLQGLQ
jgi:hypothetical protein